MSLIDSAKSFFLNPPKNISVLPICLERFTGVSASHKIDSRKQKDLITTKIVLLVCSPVEFSNDDDDGALS